MSVVNTAIKTTLVDCVPGKLGLRADVSLMPGPVPWRKEIEEGIAGCSKFVVFLDKAWATSYNCLQVSRRHCSLAG
eukprot:scaffold83474_cov47-Prasinocladus_malaysianus.AAC.1